jgi:hypothetical protein
MLASTLQCSDVSHICNYWDTQRKATDRCVVHLSRVSFSCPIFHWPDLGSVPMFVSVPKIVLVSDPYFGKDFEGAVSLKTHKLNSKWTVDIPPTWTLLLGRTILYSFIDHWENMSKVILVRFFIRQPLSWESNHPCMKQVTGASGYIGSDIVYQLLEKGYHVKAWAWVCVLFLQFAN